MKVGQIAPNQITFENNGREYFQSYDSVIACINASGNIELDKRYWNYSKTTSKYRNQFLGMTTKEIEAGIKSGEIILVDLNS